MKTIYFLPLAMIAIAGCSNAYRAQIGGWGGDYRVKLYSGGHVAEEWESDGKVLTEEKSDGWYFKDKKTGKLVRVSGTISIEQN